MIGGWIEYRRSVLFPADSESAKRMINIYKTKSIAPLDEVLKVNKLPFKITPKMMLRIAKIGIEARSYAEASEQFQEYWGISISADEIRRTVDYIGGIVFEDDCRRADDARLAHENKDPNSCRIGVNSDILYLQTDGAMLPSREGKGATIWIENKLGVAFRSGDIRYWTNKHGERCHKICKRDFCSYVGSVEEFQYHFLAMAIRNQCYSCSHIVIISDGASWIRNLKERLFPGATHILDLCHLKENVSHFANHIFFGNPEEAQTWAKDISRQLEDGKHKIVLASLEKYRDVKMPDGVINLYTYISNHADCINYPEYKANGFFIGSGVIESSHRTIMQERLKLAGMRWKRLTAQGILSLRCRNESGKWSEVIHLIEENTEK